MANLHVAVEAVFGSFDQQMEAAALIDNWHEKPPSYTIHCTSFPYSSEAFPLALPATLGCFVFLLSYRFPNLSAGFASDDRTKGKQLSAYYFHSSFGKFL